MGKCVSCGKRGLFLKVNVKGLCTDCVIQKNKLEHKESVKVEKRPTQTEINAHEPIAVTKKPPVPNASKENPKLEVLKRANGAEVGTKFDGIINAYSNNIPSAIEQCLNEGLLKVSLGYGLLETYTVPTLKDICRNHGLKVGGKKAEIIQRIVESEEVPEEKIAEILNSSGAYTLTEQGKIVLKEYALEKEHAFNALIRKVCASNMLAKFDEAYEYVKQYEQSKRVPRGLGILSNAQKKAYTRALAAKLDPLVGGMLITIDMLVLSAEEGLNKLQLLANESGVGISGLDEDIIHNFGVSISTIRDIEEYRESGVEKYEISIAYDADTCPECQKHDQKVYKVEDAVVGVNCPPFCKRCRCDTLAVYGDDDFKGEEKAARNPITGKGELIPVDMSYKKYMAKYGK